MSLTPISAAKALQQLDSFDTIIDARSEAEFDEDHLPAAQNWPTLNNTQRMEVGTTYKQINAFEAKKRGAAMAAANIMPAKLVVHPGTTAKNFQSSRTTLCTVSGIRRPGEILLGALSVEPSSRNAITRSAWRSRRMVEMWLPCRARRMSWPTGWRR